MEADDLRTAAAFCKLADARHLMEYLGVPEDSTSDEALAALKKARQRMQGMQANPKYKTVAVALIKDYRTLERVLAAPQAHLDDARLAHESAQLPTLQLAIDAVLSDGNLSNAEIQFVRDHALQLGISEARFERVLRDAAAARGITISGATPGPASRRTLSSLSGDLRITEEERARLKGAAGHGWWDANFTRMLLESIPGGPGDMVDVYCRTALSAVTLLPERRQLAYLGVDRNPERVASACDAARQFGARARFEVAEPFALPLPDRSVDYVLAIRALANVTDTAQVFHEAWRVLRPGGRMIAAEPDGLAEAFYFDANLTEYNQAFQALCRRVDQLTGAQNKDANGRPGIALGPTLSQRMAIAGLTPTQVKLHASNNLKPRRFGKLATMLRRYPVAIAAAQGLSESSPEVQAVHRAVERLEATRDPSAIGTGGNVLPIFLCVGVKE